MIQKVMLKRLFFVSISILSVITIALLFSSAAIAVLLAIVSSFLLLPICRRFEKHFVSSIAVIFCLICAVLPFLILVLLLPQMLKELQEALSKLPIILQSIYQKWLAIEGQLVRAGIPKNFFDALRERLFVTQNQSALIANMLLSFGNFFAKSIYWLIAVPILTFYFLRDRKFFGHLVVFCVPMSRRDWLTRLGNDIATALRSFIRAQVSICLIVGLLTGILLFFVGIPYALLIGFLMFIFNFVPYFGGFIGAIPVLLVSAPMGTSRVVSAMVIIFAVQQLESLLITPRIMGRGVGIHPVWVIVILLISGSLFGIFGMIFCVPLVLMLRCVVLRIYEGVVQSAKKRTDDCISNPLAV